MIEVARIPVLQDNYVWLVHEPASGETTVIDPAVAGPVLAEAERRGWRIGQVWNTHHHADHTGGNLEVKAATGARITGPKAEAPRIPGLDVAVGEGDRVRLGEIEGMVMDTPGHTAGHISYHLPSERALFVGDVMFAMGCGRLFEGNAQQMFENLKRYAALPGETVVYPAHEYTQSNGRFALTAEPDNAEIRARMAEVDAARDRGEATVPTTVALERTTNPFVRAGSAERLAELRAAKDSFKG